VSETLAKLRPDRDLQCFFFRPSASAAMSGASATGFTLSGTWRQQFDWAVIEWTRDNIYEHPLLRYLPDGDLSGLTLSYREERTNCIPIDSKLFPTVDWPYLRIWADDSSGDEQLYRVSLFDNATPVAGSYVAAEATFELQGTLTEGDYVELSWLDEHFNWLVGASDTIATVLEGLEAQINSSSTYLEAETDTGAATITLTNKTAGAEGNRLGITGAVSGAQTEHWSPTSQTLSGGLSPSQWQIDLDFSELQGFAETDPETIVNVPAGKVRKMRWTYSAALQAADFERNEFAVTVSNWSVTGPNGSYKVAGPGSRRQEDDGPDAAYSGTWSIGAGNFSGGTIHDTTEENASVTISYSAQLSHRLFLGTRAANNGGIVSVAVDENPEQTLDLYLPNEDFLVRIDLGTFGAGTHTVEATLTSTDSSHFYFDFLEQVIESSTVEAQPARPTETLATDWDTDHSLVLPPERVAWNLYMLGFHGRANHYVGAIVFYEMFNPGNAYAEGTVTFSGTTELSEVVTVNISGTDFTRVLFVTDTPETVAKSFELLINNGSTGVWAESSGSVLTIHARGMGNAGNSITLAADSTSEDFDAVASGSTLSGGQDGALNIRNPPEPWFVDLEAEPRIHRAARDWHRAYFAALDSYGIDSTAAFSTELSHGDPSVPAGMAQRYPDGSAVIVNTPGVQTNFSPASIDYWKQVYLDMAALQDEAGVTPYLQFGEVQWWYFPKPWPISDPPDPPVGMTFYDDYSTTEFQSRYSHAMHVFLSNDESPASYPDEAEFLPDLIGEYCAAIRSYVLATYPGAKFEVLYPHDVNDFALTRVVNFPEGDWTPTNLEVLKTENFGHTAARNLDKAVESVLLPLGKGFPRNRAAHLIGVFTPNEPWNWERRLASAHHIESVVLWAFDQFSMVGYTLPLREGVRRARFMR
jgi:hypothetical protein